MIPLWYQGLSNFFHEKFEKQENVDVLFHCSDGVIGAHQILVSLASKLLLRVLSDLESLDSDVVVIVPDLTVEQVTLFLSAVYGGTVPPMEDSEFQSLTDVLEVLGVEVPSKNGDVDVLKPTSIEYLVDNIVRGNLTLIFALFVQSYPYGSLLSPQASQLGLGCFWSTFNVCLNQQILREKNYWYQESNPGLLGTTITTSFRLFCQLLSKLLESAYHCQFELNWDS